MGVVKFSDYFLQQLSTRAVDVERGRQHWNVHRSFDEPCQKLFNAISVDSYIRPHRHPGHGKDECMIAVRGLLTLILFDERGNISEAVAFGTESTRTDAGEAPSVGVQIPPGVWHTVVANRPHSILFEAKAGPFDPASPKEFAPWAPEEGGGEACAYLLTLKRFCASAS